VSAWHRAIALEQRTTKGALDALECAVSAAASRATRAPSSRCGLGDRADHAEVTQLDIHIATVGPTWDVRKARR